MTNNSVRNWFGALLPFTRTRNVGLLARVAAVALLTLTLLTLSAGEGAGEPGAAAPAQAPAVSADLHTEVWWTTTGCPAGVQVPCLDPEAFTDAHSLPPAPVYVIEPGEVSDAMWDQLRAMGYRGDPADQREALYVPMAAAASACQTDSDCQQVQTAMDESAAGSQGCWVEHKADLPDETLCGDLHLMPAGSTPLRQV